MDKKMKLRLLLMIFTFSVMLSWGCVAKAQRATAYVSKNTSESIAYCRKCSYVDTAVNTNDYPDHSDYCPKCHSGMKAFSSSYGSVDGYGTISYKITVKKNKKTWVTFPAKARISKVGYVFKNGKIKGIKAVGRHKGSGKCIRFKSNKIMVKCAKTSKFLFIYKGNKMAMLLVNVEK